MGTAPFSREGGVREGLPAWCWLGRSLLAERWIGVRLGGGGWARATATTMLLSSSEELPELSLLSSSSLSVRPSVPVFWEWKEGWAYLYKFVKKWNMAEPAHVQKGATFFLNSSL